MAYDRSRIDRLASRSLRDSLRLSIRIEVVGRFDLDVPVTDLVVSVYPMIFEHSPSASLVSERVEEISDSRIGSDLRRNGGSPRRAGLDRELWI